MALLVRRLRITDFPALEAIESKHPPRPEGVEGFRRLIEVTLQEEPEGLMIAESEGAVAGWAVARQRGPHPFSGRPYGHILHLSVAKAHQRRGVGSRLLREAEAYLRSRGCESIQLSVPTAQPEAAELFKRSGFKVVAWELERVFSSKG